MPLRIVLVRHGQSTYNLQHRIQGRDDRSVLTDLGETQARLSGEALAELPLTAAYTSPLSRASETAAILLEAQAQRIKASPSEELLEIDLSPWSGLLRDELAARDPEGARRWRHAPETLELARADGSRYRPVPELMLQARSFLDELFRAHAAAVRSPMGAAAAETDSVLVVAHNGILRCLLLQLLQLPASGFTRLRLDNGSITVLNVTPDARGHPEVQLESLNGTSHLGANLPPLAEGPRLLLVRHGETDWNREGRFQGQMDIPLNATGLTQAEAARGFLADVRIDRAYTSFMSRPRLTAEVILECHPGVPLTSCDGLREIGHGRWEGRLEREIAAEWPALLSDWKRAPHTVQMPEGENLQDVWDRSLATWHTIVCSLAPDETAMVVAHDAVNKTILCGLLGLRPADIWAVKQGNGGVTVIDYPHGPEGIPVIACLNITGHLGGVVDRTAAGAL